MAFKEFVDKSTTDQALQEKIKSMVADAKVTDKKAGLIAIGKEAGFVFSLDDMKAYTVEIKDDFNKSELSEEQLDAVAGGGFWNDFGKGFKAGFVSMATSLGLCFADW
jgi:predicted ribosomally synthesized peptide with nif11-like leader